MKPFALVAVGLVLVAGLSLAIALPQGGLASLLDLTGDRLPSPPEIRLTTPVDGEGVPSLLRIAGVATSSSGDVIDVQVRIDGGRWQSVDVAPRGAPSVPFEHEVALSAGDHLVEARAWDGDAFSLPARALVRRDAATLVLAEPEDGAAPRGAFRVAGMVVGDASRVVVESSGQRATADVVGGAWSTSLELPAGLHELRAYALGSEVDSLPQRARLAVEGPTVSILSPLTGASYGEAGDLSCGGGCILFSGTSDRAASLALELDGRSAAAILPGPTGAWTWRLPMLGLANGTHRVVVTAADATGAPSVPREIVFLARTPIDLRITGEGAPALTYTPLHFEAVGEHAATVVWSLDGAEIGEGPRVDLQLTEPGDHHLVARTQPPLGTASTAGLSLHARNRAPSVSLVDQGFPVGADTVLRAEASDEDGRVVEYRWGFHGGGNVTTGVPEITHRFAMRGLQLVNLTVTDDHGATARTSRLVLVPNAPPKALFSWEPKEPTIHDVVNFTGASLDPDGLLASRLWTFPDGTTSQGQNASHRFSTAGEHAVTLSVVDDDGAPAALTQIVRVANLPPVAAFVHTPLRPQADEDVVFTDLSVDPEGRLVSWRWDMGDGTLRNTSAALHRYADPGVYLVNLTVTDHLGATANASFPVTVVDTVPTLRTVVFEPPTPRSLQNVTFRAVAADREGGLTYRWDFGDGSPPVDATEPIHRFPRSGTYHANVTAIDDAGLNVTLPFVVHVGNTGPVAQLRLVDGGYAAFPSLLEADARDPDGSVALYRFDANGDGEADCITTHPRCAYTYALPGTFAAHVWVEDQEGAIGEASWLVTMEAPPSHLVPPTVRIEAPAPGAILRGIQALRGDASGVRPIAKVELQLQQGAWAFSGSKDAWRLALGGAPWSSLLDTRPFPDGDYDLVVRATDAGGGVGYERIPIKLDNGERETEVTVQLSGVPELLLDDAVVRGSAYHPQGVTSVRWRIDEGTWRFVGASPLAFGVPLDLDDLGPGEHLLQVEAFRGMAEKAVTNATFRVPGAAPTLVVDEPPPDIAYGLIRATGRVIGPGHAQWKLDHGLWEDLPPGDWVLAHETMRLPGGAHEVTLRAMSPEGFPSETKTYAFRIVNPAPPEQTLRSYDDPEPRATPGPSLLPLLALIAAVAACHSRWRRKDTKTRRQE